MPKVEAKFLIQNPKQVDEVLHVVADAGYAVKKRSSERLIDQYFDTPDWAILRAGWAFRHRECQGRSTLTLKALGSRRGAVFVRDQIEQTLPAGENGGAELPAGPVKKRLGEIGSGGVRRKLFRIENRRSVYVLDAPGEAATEIRLGVDRAQIRAATGDKAARGSLKFSELEVELQRGDADHVEHLAALLGEEIGLLPAQLSKFERGMQAAGFPSLAEHSFDAVDPPSTEQPMLELIYYHLNRQLCALKLQQPRAWEGLDPEGVHQMRVAIRRIRSVMRAFRDMLRGETVDHLNTQLRWLARKLGEVRDADVYWEVFHRDREAMLQGVSEALEPYERHLEEKSAAARAALIEALASDRYAELLSDLERFVTVGPQTAFLRRFGTVRISDGDELYVQPAIRRIRRFGGRITPESPAKKLHKLRIEGKRLRYLLEFFREVEPKRWKRPLKAARRLQDLLGGHQDAYMARDRLDSYAQSVSLRKGARECLLSLGRLMQREEDRMTESRRRFPATWARFERDVTSL